MELTSESPTVSRILKDRFGFSSLRPGQKEVIDSVLAGENLLAVMPTGGGKSLCFQLPALILPGTTIVISPLIALMKDQKQKLDLLNINTLELNSHVTVDEQEQNISTVQLGKTEFLYVTPEKFVTLEFQKSIKNLKVDLLVIDEAHCISQWGHDFRPAYLRIVEGWKAIGQPQILALTATATNDVIEDIKLQLKQPRLKIISQGIYRPNLFYAAHVLDKEADKVEMIESTIREATGAGIIYSATVKSVETLYDQLSDQGFEVFKYHGKLSAQERTEQRIAFMKSSTGVMIATNAFGMGIDKADIRYIIHLHFPGSLEAYYQESGRAGRDGKPSKCILLFLKKDKATQSFFNSSKYPSLENLKRLYQHLQTEYLKSGSLDLLEIENLEGLAKSKTATLLSLLKQQGVVKPKGKKWDLHIPNLTELQLTHIMKVYSQKKTFDAEKLKEIIRYSQTALCRWHFILDYFSDPQDQKTCGRCDNCARGTAELLLEA